jgi:hypothetical protein
VCNTRGVTRKVYIKCRKCELGLSVKRTFRRLPHQGTFVGLFVVTSLRKIWASSRYVSTRN